MENTQENGLHKVLPIGLYAMDGGCYKEYSLLKSNGIAEKVFADRIPQKPYTWMGNVLTIAIDELAGNKIAGPARREYSSSGGSITIHPLIKQLTLADVSTLLVEIHRTVWQNLIRNQEVLCKYCGEKMTIDIDLNRITMSEEVLRELGSKSDWATLVCDLPEGFVYEPLRVVGGSEVIAGDMGGVNFNRFVFRNPTLQDALAHEKHAADGITMWRKIALDCLVSVQAVHRDDNGGESVSAELPRNVIQMIGMKLFDEYLYSDDLNVIKTMLREVPTLPFNYDEECPNPVCRRETPVTIEASNFFSA